MITRYFSISSHLFKSHSNPVHPSYTVAKGPARYFTKECGIFCPVRERKSIGDPGVASFQWNPRYTMSISQNDTTDSLLAESVISWRFSNRCGNIRCVNYSPDNASVIKFLY